MRLEEVLDEFHSTWLPNITMRGLSRLTELIESGSPLLVHGTFTKACAMGCLATHIAWNHPKTADRADDAGVIWLTKIAGLNPATSAVILAWDRAQSQDWTMRKELVRLLKQEQAQRENEAKPRWLRTAALPVA
jgi:hypothetical protein